jgi:hypothetical protein
MNRHLNNDGQEWKTGHNRVKEGSKEDEYAWCTLSIQEWIYRIFKLVEITVRRGLR